MDLVELLRKNRSYRRFDQRRRIDRQTLVELVELARLCPSSSNRQPLKFIVACSPEEAARVFPYLAWAGAIKDWDGPAEGERPAAYILILGDKQVRGEFHLDPGIAAQSMLLGAVQQGLGGCMIAAIDHRGLRRELNLPERFEICLAVALGHPAETVVLEEMKHPGEFDYWRDAEGVHHVPKRPLAELLLEF